MTEREKPFNGREWFYIGKKEAIGWGRRYYSVRRGPGRPVRLTNQIYVQVDWWGEVENDVLL